MSAGAPGPVLRVEADAPSAAEALARWLATEIRSCVQRKGRCRVALSGGSTPRLLFARLAEPDLAADIPWEAVHVYWSDERCVAPDDPSSNYAMAKDALIDRVPLLPGHVHPVDGTLPPALAADAYAALLGSEPLDIVLLGMGGDGHTASLFPGGPELQDETRTVIATRSPVAPADRVSLTLRSINRADRVVFLVVGADKAAMVARVMSGGAQATEGDGAPSLPAARVRPTTGSLHWYLDQVAASALQGEPPVR